MTKTTIRSSLALGAAIALCIPVGGIEAQTGSPSRAYAISARDRQEGAQAHAQLLQEFGGRVEAPQSAYVETVGKNIAVQSGLSNARGDFNVTLLNSPVNNAFASPGGYVYVTRQLVALMNNEAELAGVLGHEIAHVAARHAAKRQKAATRNSILGALGGVLSGVLLGNSQIGQMGQSLISQGSQMLTLQYSRGQETEADNLGIAYLQRAGYDPRAMGTVLQSLAMQNALDARLQGSSTGRAPAWASTHPDPASRVRAALGRAGAATGLTNRDTFLARVNGLTYGDDPRQGIVDGRSFVHPQFRLAFEAPNGFYMVNGTRSVSINGQSGKGELTTAAYGGDLRGYVQNAFATLGQANQQQIFPSEIERTTVNGLPAAYGTARVRTQGGAVDVTVFAYEFSNSQAFHFMTIAQAGNARVFNPMFGSMRRISASQAGAVRPRRLAVVTAGPRDTLQSLAGRMAYTSAQMERFLVLNGLSGNSRIVPGQKVKIVTY